MGFEGKIHKPGSSVDASELSQNAVALECAGPVGKWTRGKKLETLWILWRFDWEKFCWWEIARAQALGWEWAEVLRGPAIRALNPKPALVDVLARGRELADEILSLVDTKLASENQDLRALVLSRVYEYVAGRIAAA